MLKSRRLLVLCSLLGAACGNDGAASPPTAQAGSSGNAGGGASGTAGMAAGGAGAAGAPTSGGVGAAGAGAGGDITLEGGAGSSGSGGGGGGAGGSVGACSKQGKQADPGADGDGQKQMNAPYPPAPETQKLLDGAMAGKINDVPTGGSIPKPLIYSATKQYPGLNQMLKYEYWIYVPAAYRAGCPAALMVFQDGMHYVSTDTEFNAPLAFDNLIAKGEMPVTIGVFINPGEPGDGHYDGNEYANRHQQYDKNDPTYVNFLVDEFLKDVVLTKYDIVDDPEGWAISGHSSGGIAAFMAGWYRPEKFRKLYTHDASFSNTGNYMGMSLMAAVDASALKPLRVYLMSGPSDLGGWFNANNTAFDKLSAKQYHVRYVTENHPHFPPLAGVQDFADGLRWMWRGYSL